MARSVKVKGLPIRKEIKGEGSESSGGQQIGHESVMCPWDQEGQWHPRAH